MSLTNSTPDERSSLEFEMRQLQEQLAATKKTFVDHVHTTKRQKFGEDSLSPKELVAAAIERIQILESKQKDLDYIRLLLDIRKIENRIAEDVSFDVLKEAFASLQETEVLVLRAKVQTEDAADLTRHLETCSATLHEALAKCIVRELHIQQDGSYLPTLIDKQSIDEFSALLKTALEVQQAESRLPAVLDIFLVLIKPFETRFQYHFSSRRPTNRLDKPEWFLQHVLTLLEQYHSLMVQVVQPIFNDVLPFSGLLASHEFIRALLPMITRKVEESRVPLLNDIALSVHMIAELKRFDDTLREDFGFCNRDQSYWSGIASVFLTTDIFNHWCVEEESFVDQRFIAITEDSDAFEITGEADSNTADIAINPSAIKIIDLFEAMTRKFSPVENLMQRRQFQTHIQARLLIDYLNKIRSSTDAFEALTSGFSGGFPSADVAGINGLKRLCRQLAGVSNVLFKLHEWIDEPFYLALDDSSGSPVFSNELDGYTTLKDRIEGMISSHIVHDFSQELRPYLRSQNWSSEESPMATVAATSTSSSQLIDVFGRISELFGYLTNVASVLLVHRTYLSVANKIDRLLVSTIVSKANFSRRGALQFKRDILQVWYTFSPYVPRPEAAMPGVSEALFLLTDGLDEKELARLEKVESALSTTGTKQDILLKKAGIESLSLPEIRSLLNRKLFRIERH